MLFAKTMIEYIINEDEPISISSILKEWYTLIVSSRSLLNQSVVPLPVDKPTTISWRTGTIYRLEKVQETRIKEKVESNHCLEISKTPKIIGSLLRKRDVDHSRMALFCNSHHERLRSLERYSKLWGPFPVHFCEQYSCN